MGELKPEEIVMAAMTKVMSTDSIGRASIASLDKESGKVNSNFLTVPGRQDADTVSLKSMTELDAVGRETWSKKMDFLLSVIGFAVDLSNVWRFPYLVYDNGGGAFLLPYFLLYFTTGLPLFYMELSLGQYNKKGAITTWARICPMFKGIGYSVVLIAFYVDFYYNVIISWAIYYFFQSFTYPLPWSSCNNTWNSEFCYEPNHFLARNASNRSDGCSDKTGDIKGFKSSAEEFFLYRVLSIQHFKGVEHPGIVKWELAVCLLVVYIICYFSLWKGIKMSGKVVWFTAVFPYIVLFALLIRGVTLPGAIDGIKWYLTPDIHKLKNGKVWFAAATQVFFSLGPGFGVLLAFASYNPFHNNVYSDALITSFVNTMTSVLAGFVIFSVLGYMACQSGRDISDVASEGPGLVFVVYPEALTLMPACNLWALVFFMMLLTLGLDSSFGGSEAIITAISDEFTWVKRNREVFVACLFSLYFIVGLLMCSEGGIFFVEFMNWYVATFGLLIAVLCETVVISWIYGIRRFGSDIREMLGFQPGWYWYGCWAVVAPIFLGFTLVYGLATFQDITIYEYQYPKWMKTLGWVLAFSSASTIPMLAIYTLVQAPGNTFSQKLRSSIKPWKDSAAVKYSSDPQAKVENSFHGTTVYL